MYCLALVLLVLHQEVLSLPQCDTIDISDGQRRPDGYIAKDNVYYSPSNYLIDGDAVHACTCSSSSCFKKCCPPGQFINSNKTCTPSDVDLEISQIAASPPETYSIIGGWCLGQSFLLDPENSSDKFRIMSDGKLEWSMGMDEVLITEDYCVDYVEGVEIPKAVVCVVEDMVMTYYSTGMIISMPFLLITFLVYATLPDRNIHGKSLMCYVLSLLLAYVFLVAILMKSDYQPVPCQILAYVCYFFFLASFFWMNVMCIDIWWTFSGKRGIVGSKRKSQKRFILFSCYAWGVPIFFLALLAVLNHTLPENSDFHPKVGYMKCWISDGVPLLLYFYGTMALLIVFNVILFILTALKIRQAKKETAMLKKGDSKRHSYENEKQRFNLYLKLLLAMGLNWAMEVISWIFEWQVKDLPKTVWILTDTCNALYGVFIFFIFVFKRNIWNHLQRRYYVFTGRSVKANNLANSISNPTRTTSQSFQDKIPMGEVASSVGP